MSDRLIGSVESYAHRAAKQLVVGWLRDEAERVGWDNSANLGAIGWRVNRPGPSWGIWAEYPVLADGTGVSPVWDEEDPCWRLRPPSYEDVVNSGFRPMVVLDIAVQHKGQIAFGIEIVHKHSCEPRKIGFLRDRLTLIEIPAYWALGQVDRPEAIPAEFFLTF